MFSFLGCVKEKLFLKFLSKISLYTYLFKIIFFTHLFPTNITLYTSLFKKYVLLYTSFKTVLIVSRNYN